MSIMINIPLKFVIVESTINKSKYYELKPTPLSIEVLLNDIVYQFKPGSSLYKMKANKGESLDTTLNTLCFDDTLLVLNHTNKVIEYIKKEDLEPYELSEYDKDRLKEYNARANTVKMFELLILPHIQGLTKDYPDLVINTNSYDKRIEIAEPYNAKRLNKEQKEKIISKLKDLGCVVFHHYGYGDIFAKVDINKTIIKMRETFK